MWLRKMNTRPIACETCLICMEDEHEYVDTQVEEQNEIADQIFGMVARRNGEPRDKSKSAAWLRGWDQAQE
jgi:hypothetical protein